MSLPSVDGEESAPKRTSSFKLPSVRSASVDPVLSGTQSARQGRNRDSSDRLPRLQSERVRSHKRSRSLLPPITGENKGKNDSDDIAALASPVGLNGTKLLHQLSRDTFYRDGRPRRHSGASTSTASTKRCVSLGTASARLERTRVRCVLSLICTFALQFSGSQAASEAGACTQVRNFRRWHSLATNG